MKEGENIYLTPGKNKLYQKYFTSYIEWNQLTGNNIKDSIRNNVKPL